MSRTIDYWESIAKNWTVGIGFILLNGITIPTSIQPHILTIDDHNNDDYLMLRDILQQFAHNKRFKYFMSANVCLYFVNRKKRENLFIKVEYFDIR